jgi:hypothetical protein
MVYGTWIGLARTAAVVAALALGTWPAGASSAPADAPAWTANLYLQRSFPKQTRTNRQIAEINDALGTRFDDWGDITNLSVGGQLLRRVAPRWKLGLEADYSQGELAGHALVPTEAGPARVDFRQRYSTFADLFAAAHFLPCPGCRRAEPFVLVAAGVGFEKDYTTLRLHNDFVDERLRVDNDGTFPVFTAGVGVDLPLGSRRTLFLQLGGAYFWGRFQQHVPARGSLAPAPEVLADTDSTGPNYWIGVSWHFGSER